MSTRDRVFQILKEFNLHCESLTDKTQLIAHLGINSISMIELLTMLESEFEITIEDSEVDRESFLDIGGIVGFVNRKLEETNKI